ncbi:Agamous-like MADS-box protein [Quillaja saponaria]|uniref:Agamous-like MADS-box protein n=1 Tax=Quillaja saponaria TaxID=32244 RepID=A0AAD7P8M8_QUISA|nr:Agamous-like MADS-box protein [Quillaja saponaria]
MVNQTTKPTALGRKKIEIKKIDDQSNKQVTFSKRRAGIFKKASEICVLCNAQVAVVVFSPAEKVFCFGHPDAETVLNRYLNGTFESEPMKQDCLLSFEQLNKEYEETVKVMEMEKQRLAEIENAVKAGIDRWDWLTQPIDQMNAQELEEIMEAMKEMRNKLAERADQIMRASLLSTPSFYEGSPVAGVVTAWNYCGGLDNQFEGIYGGWMGNQFEGNYGGGMGNQFEGSSGFGCRNFRS